MLLKVTIVFLCFSFGLVQAGKDTYDGPVLDVHLHAGTADQNGPPGMSICHEMMKYIPTPDPSVPWPALFMEFAKNPSCDNPITGSATDSELLDDTIAQLKRNNAIGVISGNPDMLAKWKTNSPGRFLPSLQLNLERDPYGPDEARKLIQEQGIIAIGEISNQYVGISPNDPRMDAFYSLAEELDIPVAIHMGGGPPGTAAFYPKYTVSAGDPILLESVLQKYPKLRVSIMHMAGGYYEKVKMLLYSYPNLYLDIGGLSWMRTNEEFEEILMSFVNAGWGGRIMFGSDQMNWPGLITPSIDVIRYAEYLTLAQKKAILWSNAIRFFKLNEKEMLARAQGN
jgi:predicted TIM-barrel fold metal-dependent hydrolase